MISSQKHLQYIDFINIIKSSCNYINNGILCNIQLFGLFGVIVESNKDVLMTLSDKIMAIYPSLTSEDFKTVITLQNDSDGKGDYIAAWNHPTLARPTEEQLND